MDQLKGVAAQGRCRGVSARFPTSAGRILVAGNGAEGHKDLRAALAFQAHKVTTVATNIEVLATVASGQYDLLVLDSEFDMTGGVALCRSVRSNSGIGIIILSADDGSQARIDALNAGADDFLAPGFILPEFLARVRAILRRVKPAAGNRHQVLLHDRAINFQAHQITGPNGRIVHLTPKECLLLRHMVTHANRPLTAQNLARNVWQRDGVGQIEFVRVVVKQLRRKLEPDPDNPQYILTQRAAGYQFHLPATADVC